MAKRSPSGASPSESVKPAIDDIAGAEDVVHDRREGGARRLRGR